MNKIHFSFSIPRSLAGISGRVRVKGANENIFYGKTHYTFKVCKFV